MTEGWKHEAAKKKVAFELSLYFNIVREEVKMPVPNPEFVMSGNLNSSTRIIKTYHLDVYAEDPILRKIESIQYPRIGVEIDGEVGHKRTKRQHKRDVARTQQLCDYDVYQGMIIVRFDSEYIAGKGFRDPRNNFVYRPKLTPEEILKEMRIRPRKIPA